MELSGGEIALLAGLLVVTGGAAGVLAGLLGVGGGIVIVPVLFWVLGALGFPEATSMAVAVATSLATIVPTSISSARAHAAKGNLDTTLLRAWGPFVFAGALGGGLLSFVLDGSALTLIFGVVALAVALNMAVPGTRVPAAAVPALRRAQGAMGAGIGALSALMGIGGGTLSVPTLTLLSVPTHRAVGTAAAFGLVIALPGMVGFVASGWGVAGRPPLSLGYVNLPAAAIIVSVSVFAAPLGARLAHSLPAARLKQAFALFLGITAMRMLWTALA
jgi:uncharacterized membrane protein YfcA